MGQIRHTVSVCPECLQRVPAQLIERDGDIYLEKSCPHHGFFSTVTWRGAPALHDWSAFDMQMEATDALGCPWACGLCPDHKQGTCCVLLEVTDRCNLACSHCFAEASPGVDKKDPPLAEVMKWVSDIAATGQAFLQLSGGEPTLRDDLPQIVCHARQAGCAYVQLNSNGLRLADDEAFVAALAEAGLSFVFMQFDGTKERIYKKLRGRSLLQVKEQAIEACGKYNIGVTLVPTIVPGVNEQDIGNILRFAVARAPVVRGVHFQPVSYFGRYPQPPGDAHRITLPEVLQAVYRQAADIVPEKSLAASRCDHARCGFHGAYIATPGGLHPLTKPSACCNTKAPAENNRHFVGLRWQRNAHECCAEAHQQDRLAESSFDLTSLDTFLQKARSHSFTISAMAFQDAYTLDLERLRQCSLHVYSAGSLIPFCAYYLNGGKAIRIPKVYVKQ